MQNFLVFLGSARDSTPPRPARLGLRVARQCEKHLQNMGNAVELIDPLSIELPAGAVSLTATRLRLAELGP